MHWLALTLALALSPLSYTLCFASLHSRKEGCGFQRLHSETRFQKFAVSARRCYIKGKPKNNKSVSFDAKTCAVLTVPKTRSSPGGLIKSFAAKHTPDDTWPERKQTLKSIKEDTETLIISLALCYSIRKWHQNKLFHQANLIPATFPYQDGPLTLNWPLLQSPMLKTQNDIIKSCALTHLKDDTQLEMASCAAHNLLVIN